MKTMQNDSTGIKGNKGGYINFRFKFKSYWIILCMIIFFSVMSNPETFSQGVGISEVSITPEPTSILELRSTLRGLLAPRMTTVQRDAILTPATGLLIYNTTTNAFNYHNGTGWIAILNIGTGVTSITGTTNRISIGGTPTVPAIDIAGSYVGQTSITTLGTIGAGTWNGATIGINYGGTGQTTANAAFNALSPMTTLGDVIYGASSGGGTRLAGNTTTTPMYLKQTGNGTVSSAPVWGALGKSDVGLGNVDNTTDLNKPISTLTQSSLNLKADLASPSFTGVPLSPTAAAGTSTTQIATTAFVTGAIATGATPDATTLVKGKVQLAGDLTGTAASPTIAAGAIDNSKISASAGIVDSKLATISTVGKVSNSATTATSVNTPSTIVLRDGSGNFSAGTITAIIIGNVSGTSGSTTGNASTATTLATARTINGVSFNGSIDITVPVNSTDDLLSVATVYPLWTTAAGNTVAKLSTTKLRFVPNTGILTATGFAGSGAGLTGIPNGALTNNNVTIGTTAIALGASSTTLTGLTSISSTSFTGALTGNASTATILATARAINGTNFNGSSAITVPVNSTDDLATAVSVFPLWTTAAGNIAAKLSTTKLSFVPSTGILTATGFAGNLTGNVIGNATTSTTAGNVTGIVAIVNGGTGSSAQNFVDLTTNQTIAGAKTWSNLGTFNAGLTSIGSAINLNAGSNFATNINTGSSTGIVTIGNAANSLSILGTISGANPLVFDGATANANKTTFAITEPTVPRTITFPDASGTVALVSNTSWNLGGNAPGGASILGTTDNSGINIQSGTGAINIGAEAGAKTINIGNGTGATSLALSAGTGNIDIGSNNVNRTITIGNTSNTFTQNIVIGGNAANTIGIGNTQTAGSVTLGGMMTTGTISIGGAAQTGALTIGSSTGTQTVYIGNGTAANNVNISTSGTGNVTIGNATGTVTLPKLTLGSIPFAGAGGLVSQDNTGLFWDNSNKRLGIGTASPSATLTVMGDVNINGAGSTTAAPRTIGINPWTTDNAARYTFGDPWNALQNSYGGRMQLVAYWGVDISGHTESGSARPFVGGTTSDASLNVIGTLPAAPVLIATSAPGQTANIQEWDNSAGTTLASVNSTGKIFSTGAAIYGAFNWGVDAAGGNDDYVITLAPAPTAYVAGMMVIFKAGDRNQGSCTMNVNGLGPKFILRDQNGTGSLTTPGDDSIDAAGVYILVYDGTQFVLIR